MSSEQSTGGSAMPDTATETITRTIVCNLETSQSKNRKVQDAIDEFAEMMAHTAVMLPSFGEFNWHRQNNTIYQHLKEEFGDDRDVYAAIMRNAGQVVAESFASWRERGKEGKPPQPDKFRKANYIELSNQEVVLEENDRGWGIGAKFLMSDGPDGEDGKPIYEGGQEWFHISDGAYQREYLERITDGDASLGSVQFRLTDDGSLSCHLVVKWDIEVYEPSDVSTVVGIDLGENSLYAASVVEMIDTADTEEGNEIASVNEVEIKSGREYRHMRTQLDRKRRQLQKRDDLRGIRKLSGERRRYTEQMTHTTSREIVDIAGAHAPAVIRIEDLMDYRSTADEPIHDWPYAMLQEQICYKATESGIPVQFVDAKNTSIRCRKCGFESADNRDGNEFVCQSCGYEVHADVNAAYNIAVAPVND